MRDVWTNAQRIADAAPSDRDGLLGLARYFGELSRAIRLTGASGAQSLNRASAYRRLAMAQRPIRWCVFCGRKPQVSERGACRDCDR